MGGKEGGCSKHAFMFLCFNIYARVCVSVFVCVCVCGFMHKFVCMGFQVCPQGVSLPTSSGTVQLL